MTATSDDAAVVTDLEQALLDADLEIIRLRVDRYRLEIAEAQAARVPALEESLSSALKIVDVLRARVEELEGLVPNEPVSPSTAARR